jgi:hypothetical protein
MKKQLTVAVTAGLFGPERRCAGFRQVCGPGTMIEFDADAFAWESNYNQAR